MAESNSDSNKTKKKEKSAAAKKAAVLSAVLWGVGFLLLFVLEPGSRYVWTSDALLLLGFFPGLFLYRAGWTWFVFGLINTFTGFMLIMATIIDKYIDDKSVLTPQFYAAQDHITKMHPGLTWILLGLVAVLFGLFRMTRTIIRWVRRRMQKRSSE